MEDSFSSSNHKINKVVFSDDKIESSSSEDSSWSLYFDNSVASSNAEDTVNCSGPQSSSIFSGIASVKCKYIEDDQVASAQPVHKRRKIRETYIDHDLEDTATSPVSNSEVLDLEQLHLKLQETGYDLKLFAPMRLGKHDHGRFLQEKQNTSSQTGDVLHSGFIGEDINYAGLREKGLCLIPVSLLFQV